MASKRETTVPYHEQIANVPRAQVTSRSLDISARLPAERYLCSVPQASRGSIR